MQSKIENAAATYIQDTRHNPCTLEEIAEWYGIDIQEIKSIASRSKWDYFRSKERKGQYGYVEYIKAL
ncbi:MAG: hypothetical protein F8N39_18115 [Clostridiaceae bacterium]|nr:hypothetical protein [Clostridiaceae bacterium]